MAFLAVFMGPTWEPSSTLAMKEGRKEGRQMKSEDVIVKSEGTLHTPFLITRPVLMVLWVTHTNNRVHCVHFWSGDPQDAMLGVYCRWRPSGFRLGAI